MSTWAIESLVASLRGRRVAMLDFAEYLENHAGRRRRRRAMRKVAAQLRWEAKRVQHDLDHVFGSAEAAARTAYRLDSSQRLQQEERMGRTFNRSDFDGAVLLKHWVPDLDGRTYRGYVGKVSILSDKELLGFEVTGTESNWVARIQGPSGQSVNFPGCQVQGVFVEPNESPVSNDYKVLA